MEHVIVRTGPEGMPTAVLSRGREWAVGAEPVRWYERVNWWEVNRRMPKGLGRVDVEVLQVQVRLGSNRRSALTTMLLERDGLGGGWRLREAVADAASMPVRGHTVRGQWKALHRGYWGMPRGRA